MSSTIFSSSLPSLQPQETVQAQVSGICGRSFTVQSAILRSTDAESCADVTSADLASIKFLYLRFFFGGLRAGDLDGLTALDWLGINGNNVIPFPTGVFDDLVALEFLYVRDAAVTTVPTDSFAGFSSSVALETMLLSLPEVTTIATGAFNGLAAVERFILSADQLTAINADTFDGLGNPADLTDLVITGDEIATIAVDAFANLTNLDILIIRADAVTQIEAGTFNGLGNLTFLSFSGESVTTVPSGAFSGIGENIDDAARDEDEDYTVISLTLDALTSLGANTFSGLSNLERLAISGDMLATLEPDVFAGLDSLDVLYIDAGEMSSVSAGVFDDFPVGHVLKTLRLDRGGGAILRSRVLNELQSVDAIDVWDPELRTIEAGFFTGVSTLQRLFFDDAGNISKVERRAFSGLTELTKLDLSNNRITTLPDDIFDGLTELEALELGGNPLVRLPAGLVASPPCGLTTFDISGHGFKGIPKAVVDGVEYNILSTLPQPGVNGCGLDQGLRHLILDDIPLTQADLDLIEPYKVLETLSLANTRITAEQAINVRRGQDLVTLKSLDLSHNDLSGLNGPAQRTALGVIVARLVNLEVLDLANTRLDGDTALVIVQNVNPNIVEFSLAGNNLADWNHPHLARGLERAWSRLWRNWNLIDLSNTAIDSRAASSIVPYIERTHEGIPEDVIDELDEPGVHAGVTLDLSSNYLTSFGSGWLRNWEYVDVIDLSCNEISTVRPQWFLPVSRHLEALYLRGNPLDPLPDYDEFDAVLPDTHLHILLRGTCQRTDYSVPKSISKILRIEPSIRAVSIKPGRSVTLAIDLYGRQDVLDNSLAESVIILWDDANAGGIISGTGKEIKYTAPEQSGSYTLTARLGSEQCYGDFEGCTARFRINVIRTSSTQTLSVEPIDPSGAIPSILTDDDGLAYEVLTPSAGGRYAGEGFNLTAFAGSVQNGEYIGVSMQQGETASNVGQTHHRFTIGGDWYEINAIDSGTRPLGDYRFNVPLEVCIPLPYQLRARIDDVAVVAMDSGATDFTVLSSQVRLQSDGEPQLCGNLSSLPTRIAAAKHGAPDALPTPDQSPVIDEALPETGGLSPSIWLVLFISIIGASVVASALFRLRRSSAHPTSTRSMPHA